MAKSDQSMFGYIHINHVEMFDYVCVPKHNNEAISQLILHAYICR